jgi:hypothetical protein
MRKNAKVARSDRELTKLTDLERLAWRLVRHDAHAAFREGRPGCIELKHLYAWLVEQRSIKLGHPLHKLLYQE